jgi:hypothetical protein
MGHGRGGGRTGRAVGVKTRHAAFFFLALSWCFGAASAQDLTPLINQCASGGSSELLTSCQSAVLAVQAVRGGIGLADASGADLAGASSTIGRRLGSAPRVSVDLRLRMARFRMPDILDGGTGVSRENTIGEFGLKGSLAVGVLDGLSLMPTVGGVLSLDLIGSGSFIFLGEPDGFLGNEGLLSVGGRLGIFRESFTMPGLTVSVMRSFGQNVDWSTAGVSGSQLDADISTTSIRAMIGKSFFSFAVLGGVGWNWDRGEMGVQVPDPTITGGRRPGRMNGLTTRRTIYFAGVSITRLVFQFSVEGGWAGGYDGLPGYSGAYDPGATTPFVSVAGRLTI